MTNADPLHSHCMALTNVGSILSEKERTQLVNTLVFLVRNKHPSATNVRDFNLVTIKNTPGIWSGLPNAYRIDVTFRKRTIIFGREVNTGLEVLECLCDSAEKRAGQVILDSSGPPNGRVLATDERKFDTKDPKAPENRKPESGGYVAKNTKGEFAHLGAIIVKGDNSDQARRRTHAGLKRKAQEQNDGMRKKARGEDYVANEETLDDIEEGEILEYDEGHGKAMDHDAESEHDNVEGGEPPPSIGAVFAKYAAGELKGRKWKGRIADANTEMKRNTEGIAEGNVSDDEQRIIGEDDEFWHDR